VPPATPARRSRPRPPQEPASERKPASTRKPATKKFRKDQEEQIIDVVVEDIQSVNPSVNIILNGESGVGKTVLAGGASALLGARVVFCSTEEEGIISAKRAGSTAKLIRAPDWELAVSGLKWGEKNLGPDDWMIFDSGTRMHYLYMRWIMQKVKGLNPTRDVDIPAMDNHQKIQNGFMRWYDDIIKAPFNSIFITVPMTMEDAEGENKIVPQTFDSKGKVSKYISAQASVILYYDATREIEGKEGQLVRRLYAQPWPPYVAKDRYSALGPGRRIEENDFTAMADIIRAIYKAREEVINAGPGKAQTTRTRSRRASG
jgi:AAA domain